MAKKIYLQDTYQFDFEGLIQKVETDAKGLFLTLDQTAFYPQGGGQPSDHGVIRNDHFEVNIIHVAQLGDQIRHYIEPTAAELFAEQKVHGVVNRKKRLTNARYHTAGHLLAHIVEILNPKLKTIKGHSFPGEAYVEFQGYEAIDIETLQNRINEAIARDDKTRIFEIDAKAFEKQFYKQPYSISDNKNFRVMQIGHMVPVPCGGTHLSSIREIGSMKINKIKNKKGILHISYEVI